MIKTDVDLVLIMKIVFPIDVAKIKLFSFYKPEVLYLPPFLYHFLSFFIISQILKTKFHVFWKQTSRNIKSIKLANFLSITCP